MDTKRYKGKTLDGAITEACAELGITSDKLKYKVVQTGSDGLFGLGLIGAKKYVIEITDGKPDRVKPTGKPAQQTGKQDRQEGSYVKQEKFKSDKTVNAEKTHTDDAASDGENVDKFAKRAKFGEKRNPRNADKPRRFERGSESEDRSSRRNSERYEHRNNDRNSDVNGERYERKNSERNSERNDDRARNFNGREHLRSDATPHKYEKTGTVTGDPVKTAEEFLTSLFKSMEMDISYKGVFKDENNELIVDLAGEDMGVLIGKRGQTLDALQYLTSQVVNKHQTAYIRVKIDTENYRERRRETMESLARGIALKVKKTHKPVALEPMNPYERRIIHAFLQNEKDIITKSEGVEPYRHVIVCPVKKNDREK